MAVCGVLLFYLIRNFVLYALRWNSENIIPGLIFALIGAAIFAFVSYEKLPSVFRILTRTTAVGILFYLVFEPPDFTLANSAHARIATFVDLAYWVALGASLVSIWRPSFLYSAAFYVIATRYVVDEISGFALSTLDIKYMVEMAQFLALSACGVALVRIGVERLEKRPGFQVLGLIDFRLLALCLAFIATGFHLGNYFWSGFAKVALGPQPWSWALENETQNIMLAALKKGVLPSGAWPTITQGLYDGMGHGVTLSNMFVLGTQLFAVVAVLRVGWLRIATLAYDVLHIGIFVVGGLFFWPWIWNNVSILLALRRKSDHQIDGAAKLCCIVAIMLGGSHALGASARLAWWDVPDIKVPMIQAQAEEGVWIDVPVSYFLSHSYAVSHGYLDLAKTQGHYSPSIWGSVAQYDRLKTPGTCPEPTAIENPETQEARKERLARVTRFIKAHHSKMVERVDKNGRYNFYVRSHHHPSNPWLHEEFNSLDLREIKRYRLLTQSVCMTLSEGQLLERIVEEDSITFEIDG